MSFSASTVRAYRKGEQIFQGGAHLFHAKVLNEYFGGPNIT